MCVVMNKDYKGINKNKIIVYEQWDYSPFYLFDICNCLYCF